MNKTKIFFKQHTPAILSTIGAIGVVGTAILSVTGTPKALYMIEKAEKEKQESLTIPETIQVAWKPYIPAFLVGTTTIFCILGGNYLNVKNQQSLISSYLVLDKSFKEFRMRMNNIYDDEKVNAVYNDIMREQLEEMGKTSEEMLFFEFNSLRFFESNINKVLEAEQKALIQFETTGHLTLNDYYMFLGIDPTPYGELMGWSKYQMETEQYIPNGELEFMYERDVMKNGIICYVISTNTDPTMDHFCL